MRAYVCSLLQLAACKRRDAARTRVGRAAWQAAVDALFIGRGRNGR